MVASKPLILSRPKFLTNIPLNRFFETEAIVILTMLVSRYKIEVKEEPQFSGETFEETKARITASKSGITMTCVVWIVISEIVIKTDDDASFRPIRVPLVLKRR